MRFRRPFPLIFGIVFHQGFGLLTICEVPEAKQKLLNWLKRHLRPSTPLLTD
jgi:hypothetical protein